MNTFYENLFSGCSKHESLRNAQHYVKEFEDDNGNKPFEAPYYWAAWILLDALN
jgi:CHAT domain-containing protein